MLKLSIIIPAYNSEKYIKNILDSIKKQITNDDVEIIVVENGSSDNTYDVVKEYASKHQFIKLYKSEKGVSKARNVGINNSSGEYLMFIDADDMLLEDAISNVINDITTNKDLYMYSFVKGKLNEGIGSCKKIIYNNPPKELDEIIKWIISKPTLRASAWSKVYRRNLIINNNIYFKEDLKYSEDSEFLLRYLKTIKNITVSNKCIYKYVLSENSAMRSYNEDRANQYIKSIEYTIDEFRNTKYMNDIYLYVLTQLNIIMVHDIFVYRRHIKFKEDIKRFKKIYNNSVFKTSLKKTNIKYFFCKELLVELMLKIKFNHIAYMLCYMKSYINQK